MCWAGAPLELRTHLDVAKKKKSVFNKPFNPAKWLEERGEEKKDDNSYEELKI